MAAGAELATALREHAEALSEEASWRHLRRHPTLVERFGPIAHVRCREDGVFHLHHLAAAIATGESRLLDDYMVWVAGLLASYEIEREELTLHFAALAEVVSERFDGEAGAIATDLINASLAILETSELEPASFLEDTGDLGRLANDFLETLLAGDRRAATTLITDAADAGVPVEQLYLGVFEPCLREVGRLWHLRRITVAQEHVITAATQVVMAQLYPRIFATDRIGRTIVVASVGGELHEVGGRMVADLFKLHGWDSHFLGANTPGRDVAELAVRVGADVVAVSVTLPTHLDAVREVIAAVRSQCSAAVLVGGRPFNQVPELWRSVDANGSARDALEAIRVATRLVEDG